MKALTQTPLTRLFLVTTLLTSIAMQTNAQDTSTDIERATLLEEINLGFDEAAKDLTKTLSDPAFRMMLWHEIKGSRNREQILDFKDVLKRAVGNRDLAVTPQELLEQSQVIGAIEKTMRAAKYSRELAEVDLYFPVDSHRQQWRGDEELLVAFAPNQDESEVTSIIAYSVKTGEQIILDPEEVPNVSTLVIAAQEHPTNQSSLAFESLSQPPHQELAFEPLSQPPQQEDVEVLKSTISSSAGGSYIGIPWLKLLEDNEPWWKGDPEIYVLAGQSYKMTAQASKLWLNDVNDEGKWYLLGDSPSGILYFYFDENYSDATYFNFREADGGSGVTVKAGIAYQPKDGLGGNVGLEWKVGDDDDDLGSRYVNKSSLSFFEHITLSTGDVEFQVDKDGIPGETCNVQIFGGVSIPLAC